MPTTKQILSFLLSLIISGLISVFIYFLLFLQTFDLFGMEEIKNPETRHAKFFYTGLVMTVLTTFITILIFRNGQKYAAIGVGLPNLIGLFLMLKFGTIYFDKSNYYEKFDRKVWLQSKDKPLKMARGLVKDNALIGLTKAEVTERLGKGIEDKTDSTECIRYWTQGRFCALGLLFENGKVRASNIQVVD